MMFFAPDEGGGEGGATGTGTETPPKEGGDSLGGSVFTPPAKSGNDRPLPKDPIDKKIESHDPQKTAAGEPGAGTTGAPTVFDPAKFAKEFSDSVVAGLKPALEQKRSAI